MFRDRHDAGLRLATKLLSYRGTADMVIGLARGGVAVSAVVSKALSIPQGVLLVKKIGSPQNPELAIGAVVSDTQSVEVDQKTIILTDDGAATGATMTAAVDWVKHHGAKKVIVALPVAPPEVVEKLRTVADDVIVWQTPPDFSAVGEWYTNFPQLTDEDVVKLLA